MLALTLFCHGPGASSIPVLPQLFEYSPRIYEILSLLNTLSICQSSLSDSWTGPSPVYKIPALDLYKLDRSGLDWSTPNRWKHWKEVVDRKLGLPEVMACAQCLYHEVSKYAHGNQCVTTIKSSDYLLGEQAALVAYFKLQDTWSDALVWKEE